MLQKCTGCLAYLFEAVSTETALIKTLFNKKTRDEGLRTISVLNIERQPIVLVCWDPFMMKFLKYFNTCYCKIRECCVLKCVLA